MWVAGQMGHSDWTMIARVYGRWMPGADTSSGSKAVAIWTAVDDTTRSETAHTSTFSSKI